MLASKQNLSCSKNSDQTQRFEVKYYLMCNIQHKITMGEIHKAGTLIVKKVQDLEGIPIYLQKKHFFLAAGLDKLDKYKAMEVSKNRNQMSAGKYIISNTVFEADFYASEVLTKYIVKDVIGGDYDLIGKAVLISKVPLKTYQCAYAHDKWEPGRCQG